MAPPDLPGIPTRHAKAVEHRPPPANPPPPESIRPAGEVVLKRGLASVSIPSAVVIALLTSVTGFFVAWANKPTPGDPSTIAKTIRDEMAAQKQETATQNAAILKRLDGVETKVDRLQDSQDRLRERVNDRIAHP